MGFAKARPIPRKTEEGFLPEVEMTMAGQENYPLFFVYAGENRHPNGCKVLDAGHASRRQLARNDASSGH